MKTRYTTGRNTRRGNRATSAPYRGCSTSMHRKVPVNSNCRVKSDRSQPRAVAHATHAAGNTVSASPDDPIASRTGRST
jgi:hypothetical protein